ncbi:MAG: V-type ATP synthase subunit I [Nitrososphaeraceae archaeon]
MSTILKPVPMTKIAVIGLKKYRQQVLSILHEMRVIQIEPLSKEANSFLHEERESDLHREISDQLLRVRALLNVLPPLPVVGKSGFLSIKELIQTVKSMDFDVKIASMEREKDKILTDIRETENNIKLLEEFSFFNEDLSLLHLSFVRSYFGRVENEKYSDFKKSLEAQNKNIMTYSKESGKITHFILLIPPNFPSNIIASAVNQHGVHLEAVPKLKGKPSIVVNNQKNILTDLNQKLRQINNNEIEYSKKYYKFLKGAEEQLEIENKKLEVVENLGVTDDVYALEGWVPKSEIGNIDSAFQKHARGTTIFMLENKENPPTLLSNPKKFRVYESFIRFYSLPAGTEFDPTLIFAFFFTFFYGMMIGDAGYGLVILLVCLWVIRRVEKKKRNFNIMPTFLRKFALTILRPTQMVKLAKVMIPGCIFTIILGFVFNLYFGFHLNGYLFTYLNDNFGFNLPPGGVIIGADGEILEPGGNFLDPLSTFGLRKLLLFSGYIGLGLVSFGLVLGILNALREGQKKHVLAKVGWLAFGWGIALLGLGMINNEDLNPMSSITGAVYFGLILGGIGLMFYGEGVRAMMELPSIISHILSYTRIVGILLASIILAHVIDFIFLKTIDNPLPQAILGIIILFVGHIFNIIIGVFEPGIQGARLLYVEFFSKFYHGNGRPFRPFGRKRRFTYDQFNIEAPKN